jgi:hypothetical protein
MNITPSFHQANFVLFSPSVLDQFGLLSNLTLQSNSPLSLFLCLALTFVYFGDVALI